MGDYDFGLLNWGILIGYLIANLILGFALSKKVHSAEDFYIGKKATPWWAIGVSVLATYISAMTFLGAPAWAYKDGISVIAIHLNYPIVIFLVVSFFLPFFFNSGVVSIYDYQEKRFGGASRVVISLLFLIGQLLSSAAVLYGTSLVISFITGVDVLWCILMVTVIALIYTATGGITAVIWTDVIQAAILILGGGLIMWMMLDKMELPLYDTLLDLKQQGKLNPIKWSLNFKDTTSVWSGVIAMTLLHTTVYGANQMMIQRTLASKSIGDAKKSFLMMGFVAFFIYFLFILLGALFYHYYDGKPFEDDNEIILSFAAEYGMPGLMGIIAAAVVAASMSSLDSAFNSMATITTVDFYEKYIRQKASSKHYLYVTRWFTVFWAALIIIPAVMYSTLGGSILELVTKMASFTVGAKLSMYALGFFSKHTTEKGLLIGVFTGVVAVLLVWLYTDISWPWYCLIGATVNILVSVPMSILLDGYQKDWSPYSVVGQKRLFKAKNIPEKYEGWYLIPGKVDKPTYLLLVFFVLSFAFLLILQYLL